MTTLNPFHRRLFRRIQNGAQCTLIHRVKRNGDVHRIVLLVLPDGKRGSCYYKTAQHLVDTGYCEWWPGDGVRRWELREINHVSNNEHKRLMKMIYPKDKSKTFRR